MNTTINALSSITDIAGEDLFAIWHKASGRTRKVSLENVAAHVSDLIAGEPDETQYSLATSNGAFSVTIVPATQGGSVWAQLTLAVPASGGTITLPTVPDRGDGQEVVVTVTNSVAALTVSGGDAPVKGAPLALGVNGFFRLRFDGASVAWYRVG